MGTTLPADTTKANFDAGTDDPKAARAEFATNADIQNSLKSALGAFAQLSNPAGSGIELVSQGGGTPDDVRLFHTHERKTVDYTPVATDRSKLLEMDKATAITLDLTAAVTLGEGWFVLVHNSGAGTLTIDPDAAELIDDAATITLKTSESLIIVCDGATFWTIGRPNTRLPAPDFTSSEQTVAISTTLDVAHGLGARPTLVYVVMRCTTNNLNWTAGDEAIIGFTGGGTTSTGLMAGADATNVTIQTGSVINVFDQSTENQNTITVGSWRFVVRAWL